MKKRILKAIPWILIVAMLALIIPGLAKRISNENKNDNIVMSVLYNDIANKVSESSLDKHLKDYLDAGINTISVMEEDINMLVARGDVTCIKYNVLKHKYDDESLEVADEILKRCPSVTYDSYIILAKRPEVMSQLKFHLADRYSEDECFYAGNIRSMDIYVLFDGFKNLWDYSIGYNENDIAKLKDMGFDIALIHKVKNYKNTGYLEYIDSIVKKYDVEYLNLKEDSVEVEDKDAVKENYEGLTEIINSNNMTLVITENVDQLSNQKFFGFGDVFDAVMKKDGGSHKVLRSYETYDDSQSEDDGYKHRVSQHFNSTIDRNIRFVTITQITTDKNSFDHQADLTLKAAKEYKQKVENQGFTVGAETKALYYTANGRLNYAACCVIMIMAVLIMLRAVFSNDFEKLTVVAVILSVIGFAGTFLLYSKLYALISLYPTLFCLVVSCFAMTMVLLFLKSYTEKLSLPVLTVSSLAIMLLCLFAGTSCMSTMLSGIDYYVNNEIFRGIKLSLLVPVAYTAVIFCLMFMNKKNGSIIRSITNFLNSEIKVYWVIIAGVILVIGSYYIIRSGNVNSISSFESFVRTTLTEMFSARPRTKEFLIGYPALILLVYYMKKIDIKLLQWLLAIAASILAASVTNSFCHVFTDYSVIVSRTVNGLIVGIAVTVIAYLANLLLVKLVKTCYKHILPYLEMK